MVAVTRFGVTKYFSGATLREALNASGLIAGDSFTYAKFARLGRINTMKITQGSSGAVQTFGEAQREVST
jgi:hypothetical protein